MEESFPLNGSLLMNEIQHWIGTRLDAFLRLKKKTVADVARTLDKDPSYIYRVKRGEENPTIEQIDMIVRACGSNLGEFFEPMLREKDPAETAAENEAVVATLEKLLNDPVSRQGAISLVFSVAAGSRPRKSTRSRK